MKGEIINKRDIILLVAIVAICVILLGIIHLNRQSGHKVSIMIDGKEELSVSLSEDATYYVRVADDENGKLTLIAAEEICVDGKKKTLIASEGTEIAKYNKVHFNELKIKDGKVYVMEADCPDKICVKHKPISSVGETIICLPHKLVIEIKK